MGLYTPTTSPAAEIEAKRSGQQGFCGVQAESVPSLRVPPSTARENERSSVRALGVVLTADAILRHPRASGRNDKWPGQGIAGILPPVILRRQCRRVCFPDRIEMAITPLFLGAGYTAQDGRAGWASPPSSVAVLFSWSGLARDYGWGVSPRVAPA